MTVMQHSISRYHPSTASYGFPAGHIPLPDYALVATRLLWSKPQRAAPFIGSLEENRASPDVQQLLDGSPNL